MRAVLALFCLIALPLSAAESIRVAFWHSELQRDGPGLLLRDIEKGAEDVQAAAVAIAAIAPDIIVLQGIDWDREERALTAFARLVADAGHDLPHLFAPMPNSGLQTGIDMDGDGRSGGPDDAHGYGRFTGNRGLALLSRFPIRMDELRDFTTMPWRELPGAKLPVTQDSAPFLSEAAAAVHRLSSTGHWIVPVDTPGGALHIGAFAATPPMFDGPEDRNGLRNRDEIRFWSLLLDGRLGPVPSAFVLVGNANLDPGRGDGHREAIAELLAHPGLQDPAPGPTVVFREGEAPMRTSYILPATGLTVTATGRTEPGSAPGRHAILWLDIAR